MKKITFFLFSLFCVFSLTMSAQDAASSCEACLEEGFYCGDVESNWTTYCPQGCVPANYIGDGWDDCVMALMK